MTGCETFLPVDQSKSPGNPLAIFESKRDPPFFRDPDLNPGFV